MFKVFKWIILIALAAAVALAVYVRLAPVDGAALHVMPATTPPDDDKQLGSFRAVRAITTTPEGVLQALETAALQTPRTQVLAGSVQEGMVTFITRSQVFGFPDFTTAAVVAQDGQNILVVYGRLHYGAGDVGVNAARVQGWLAQLGPLVAPRT